LRLKSGAAPLVTYLLEDLTPGDDTNRSLRITETRSDFTRWTKYEYDNINAAWKISRSEQEGSIRFSTSGAQGGPLTKKTAWLDGAGNVLRERAVTTDNNGRTLSVKMGNVAQPTALVEEHYSYTNEDSPAFERRLEDGVLVNWTRTIRSGISTKTIRPYQDGPLLPANPLDPANDALFLNQGAVTSSSPSGTSQTKPSQGVATTVRLESTATTSESFAGSPNPQNPWKIIVETVKEHAHKPANGDTRSPLVSSSKRFSYEGVAWPWAGELLETIDEHGTVRSYEYIRGHWIANATNPLAGSFTANAAGLAVKTFMTEALPQNGGVLPLAGVSRIEETITDEFGRGVRQEVRLHGGATPLAVSITEYDAAGRVKTRWRNGRKIYEASYVDGRLDWVRDATGRKTRYEDYDTNNRARHIVLEGLPAAGGLPATPDEVTTLSYDFTGALRERKVVRGTSEETWRWDFDTAGRLRFTYYQPGPGMAEQVSETVYAGLTRTGIAPSATKRIQMSFLDGKLKNQRGEATVGGAVAAFGQESYARSIDADGFELTVTTAGGGLLPIITEQKVNWLGQTVMSRTRGDSTINGGIIEDISTYDAHGDLESRQRSGLQQVIHTHFFGSALGAVGEVETTSQDTNTTDGVRTSTSVRYHEVLPDGWYSVTKTQNRGQTFTSKSKVGGFAANELARSITIEASGVETVTARTIDWNTLIETETVMRGTINPVTTVRRGGRVYSRNSPSVQAPVVYTYDDRGRVLTTRDPRTGAATNTTYDAVFGEPATITAPGTNVSRVYYPLGGYRAGLVRSETTNSQTKYFDYDAAGRQYRIWGTGTYPLEYGYDGNGRLETLRTYRMDAAWTGAVWPITGTTQGDLTMWIYHDRSTLLKQKQDAAGQGALYGYTAAGQLRQRTWARTAPAPHNTVPYITTYIYNGAGELKKTDYSDATPDVTMEYYPSGELKNVVDAAGSHLLEYTAGRFEKETVSASGSLNLLSGWVLDPSYDTQGRLTGLGGSFSGNSMVSQSFIPQPGTDRLGTVTEQLTPGGPLSVSYGYLPGSNLLETATTMHGGVERLKAVRGWDGANRLQSVTTTRGAATVAAYEWSYDAVGRRHRTLLADNSYWDYGYNERNEVTSGIKKLPGGSPQSGYSFGYVFDPIGNRRSTTTNGRPVASYSTTALNQYSSRQVPGFIDILATTADATNTAVTVGTTSVTTNMVFATKQGANFHAAVPVTNTSTALFQQLSIRALKEGGPGTSDYQKTVTGRFFVPKSPEIFEYDFDGNLLRDGRWSYTWDAENRLIRMDTHSSVTSVVGLPLQRLEFKYDYRGRRVWKKVSVWNGVSYVTSSERRYLYDESWNLLAEIDAVGAAVRRYLWGADLSGSREGAGGVGGLLTSWTGSDIDLPLYDGNGNVVGYVSASSGSETARYEFGPFGEPLRTTGPTAAVNSFRFSAKFMDDETGLVYYGYRYYQPQTGRWLSRDPIEEHGGANLYGYGLNDPPHFLDLLGLEPVSIFFETRIKTNLYGFTSGVKTKHSLTVETTNGNILTEAKFIGETHKLQGKGDLNASTSVTDGEDGGFTTSIDLAGYAFTGVRILPRIDYSLTINITSDCSGNVQSASLSIQHDGFPTYQLKFQGGDVYNYQEGVIFELFGKKDVTDNKQIFP
jgi:RHS repeat-associated protein